MGLVNNDIRRNMFISNLVVDIMKKNYCHCQFNKHARSIDTKGNCTYCGLEVDDT